MGLLETLVSKELPYDMFEVTEDDVALLTDKDLRTLVGRLCESELKRQNISPVAVTCGGEQDAADGGVDVRVALQGQLIEGFVPRASTGFQVKKSDLERTAILAEMRPRGNLRPSIRELAEQNGAYVIVSTAKTTDLMLRNRRDAMREAVRDLPSPDSIFLEFYDGTRLATWVRQHPELILWVREKIGKRLPGWRSYGAWAYPEGGTGDQYIVDNKVRIRVGGEGANGELNPLDGIKRLRDELRVSAAVVRLVGLSGVGKTRFVQALFDDRIGNGPLDPSLAVYTNAADDPDPAPASLLSDLVATRQRAIFVVDNCAPDAHASLSAACRCPGGAVSLITVEFDIREDQPEGTTVFSLEPASQDLIEKLIKRRYPEISDVDGRTIASSSGGNARVAIALAETTRASGTIKGLNDEELFRRLFVQRNAADGSLLTAAQALSLVYSFDGENVSDSGAAELVRLGALVGKTAHEMYRAVAELESRGLIQRRGAWRAVLPHAIANRLAAKALREIPYSEIETRLATSDSERLLKSLSRRIGYLDFSKEAQEISKLWLAPNGLLGEPSELNDLGKAMFCNVASVAPEFALQAIERVLRTPERDRVAQECKRYIQIVCSIAYDPKLFDRCTAVLSRIAMAEEVDTNNEAGKALASLFMIRLSGTHASIEQRLAVIKSLLDSDEAKSRSLGVMGLRAALEAFHFAARCSFEFGARSRDYGYWPVGNEVRRWFSATLRLAEEVACAGSSVSSEVQTVIAHQFRGVWGTAAAYDDLERVFRSVASKGFWVEGWTAVRQTIHFDSKGLSPEVADRLAKIEEVVRPSNIAEKVRSIVVSDELLSGVGLGPEDDAVEDVGKTMARVRDAAEELGCAVATEEEVLAELLPALVKAEGQAWAFGMGLARNAADPVAIWNKLVTASAVTPDRERKIDLFSGFLVSLKSRDCALAGALLDEVLAGGPLARYFPIFQANVGIDETGLDRLMQCLAADRVPVRFYGCLSGGRATDSISPPGLAKVLMAIAVKPEGWDVAIDVLYMRLFSDESGGEPSAPEIINTGCELVRRIQFTKTSNPQEYRLGEVCKRCLGGSPGAQAVREVCRKLRLAVLGNETYIFYHDDLLQGLFGAHPLAALEGLCLGDSEAGYFRESILREASEIRGNPLRGVPQDELLAWCDEDPGDRYSVAAAVLSPFFTSGESGPEWMPVARAMIDRAPDPVAVLERFVNRFSPRSWWGSRAGILQHNSKLLDELDAHPMAAVRQFVAEEKRRFGEAIRAELDLEKLIFAERDERFE